MDLIMETLANVHPGEILLEEVLKNKQAEISKIKKIGIYAA